MEIVRCLSENTSPVDGIDSAEVESGVDLRIGEKCFDCILSRT
jgi:hypothetical protein